MREHWLLDRDVRFLNHGSFGACPRAVLEEQSRWRERLEARPVQFMLRELPAALAHARGELARFVGAEPEDLAFVRNATEGVNTVLRSLRFEPGDELLTTNHTYPGCANALRFVAERENIVTRVADVPFPLASSSQVTEAVLGAVTPHTRLALLDHVTSATGLVWPIAELTRELRQRGIRVLVDGAHAPGMVPVDIQAVDADYYAANLHKWCCTPKGTGLLWVRPELQRELVPLVVSHGYSKAPSERFLAMFDWTGTSDPSAWLCVPEALRFMASLVDGGWPEVRARNHQLCLHARDTLCTALDLDHPAPDSMLGSLAALPLPEARAVGDGMIDPLYDRLVEQGFETVVSYWPKAPQRLLRVSAQLYNRPEEYDELAQVLPTLLEGA